jgi:hypothetical protein
MAKCKSSPTCKSRVAVLVGCAADAFATTEACARARGEGAKAGGCGTTLDGLCRSEFFERADERSLVRARALLEVASTEEPETLDDALTFLCLLRDTFLAWRDYKGEEPEGMTKERWRKVEALSAATARCLLNLGASSPILKTYMGNVSRSVWPIRTDEVEREARIMGTAAAQSMVRSPSA